MLRRATAPIAFQEYHNVLQFGCLAAWLVALVVLRLVVACWLLLACSFLVIAERLPPSCFLMIATCCLLRVAVTNVGVVAIVPAVANNYMILRDRGSRHHLCVSRGFACSLARLLLLLAVALPQLDADACCC